MNVDNTMSSKSYFNLSKDELYLISRAEFEKQLLITAKFAQKLFPNKNKASKVIASLTRKGRVIKLEKGKYLLVPIKAPNQQWMPNEFILAKLWMADIPYYIGYFTAYHYWGFTEQVPQTIYVLNTKKSCKRTIGNTSYEATKIEKNKYYGIKKIKIEDQEVNISDKERTLVDFIYNPIGSFENLEAVIKGNINKIDPDKFIKYLIKFPVVSVRKRGGYILQKYGFNSTLLKKLKAKIGKQNTYVALDPANKTRKGKTNKDWQIIVNR